MSERYSRVFALPENLYAVGSPVVIAAGVLLKDNQTGKVLAQLKLQSISNKIIIGVKVRLNLFDNAGNSIGLPVDFDYLDLSASRDTEFGQKTPLATRMETRLAWRPTRGSLTSPSYLVRNRTLGPPLENNPDIPPSSRDEGLRLLHGLATNLATSLQTPQEA